MLVTRMLLSLMLATAFTTSCDSSSQGKAEAPGKADSKGKAEAPGKLEAPSKTDAPGKAEPPKKTDPPVEAEPPITADPPVKTEPSKPADVPVDGRSKVSLPVGATFSETLTNPRNPVDEASWSPEPKIEGTAVEFVERTVEPPPADVDGGSYSYLYRFEAVEPGRAVVTFSRSGPGSKAPIDEVQVEVEVTGS